jgi:hypothetical protein
MDGDLRGKGEGNANKGNGENGGFFFVYLKFFASTFGYVFFLAIRKRGSNSQWSIPSLSVNNKLLAQT